LAAGFTVGCGSPLSGSNGTSCPSISQPQPPPATDAGATSEAAIEAQWFIYLDNALGKFLRGDVPAYRGTMMGTATLPTWSVYYLNDGAIAEGDAIASLAFLPDSTNDWYSMEPGAFVNHNVAILIVYSSANDQSMVFGQPEGDPTVTGTGPIVSAETTDQLWATCNDCAPSFWAHPNAIAFDLAANGTVTLQTYDGGTTSAAVTTTASVRLALVPPCDLTFDDLKTLNFALGPSAYPATSLFGFVLTGGEWVWHTNGMIPTGQPPPAGACSRGGGQAFFNYSIDIYVNASNLADYGVRNYVEEGQVVECPG
jgi:hypothetical protein